MYHIPEWERTTKWISRFFSSYQFLPGGDASVSLKELLAFGASTKGAVAAFSPLTVYDAMYAGHHREMLPLSFSPLINLCRKEECKAFCCLCWLADLGSGSRQGLCCTHRNVEAAPACSPSELPKKFCLAQPGLLPMKIWFLLPLFSPCCLPS